MHPPQKPWHACSPVETQSALGSRPTGLDDDEAARRLLAYGPNRIARRAGTSAWTLLRAQFSSVVILLLIAASGLSFLLGDYADAVAIALVVVVNAGMGFVIELRAVRAMDSLLDLQGGRALVIRGGRLRTIDAAGVVPGDVIELRAGQTVSADGRVLQEEDLRVDEAALTGESLPVSKSASTDLRPDTDLADRETMVYQGTLVVTGTGRAIVISTGSGTEVGRVALLTRSVRQEATPLERRMDSLGHRLAWLAVTAAGFVTILGIMRGQPWPVMIETGVALAVAAVPEGLPAVVTIALAVGLHRMARRHALVRRLPAVEALGAATVICTDKTRTLTSGEMQVVRVWAGGALLPVGEQVAADPRCARLLETAARASRPQADQLSGEETGASVDPVDRAIRRAAREAGIGGGTIERAPTALIPFSSERRFMATFDADAGGLFARVKGAPERILLMCSPGSADRLLEVNNAMAADGLRVIAVAAGPVNGTNEIALNDLQFEGFVGLLDPAAPGVKDAVSRLRRAGLRTIMLTGDQRPTAEAVGRDLGLLAPDERAMDGRELRALTASSLAPRLARMAIFSRITPEDKLTIVAALQQRGEIVAMIGDGINDAPALRKADIGVAMGRRGTDAAQEAAAVVLQDDRFETIVVAVEDGRVIFDNIHKVVFYLFSCNLAEILVLVSTGLLSLPLPLTPLQILWVNLVTDSLPALALTLEPAEADVMRRPPRDPQAAILSRHFVVRVFLYALLIAASTLTAFAWGLAHLPAASGTMAFMTLTLAQIFHLGNARSNRSVMSPSAAVSNRHALAALFLSLLLQLATVSFQPLASTLGVAPLPFAAWLVVWVCSAATAVVGQALHAWRSP